MKKCLFLIGFLAAFGAAAESNVMVEVTGDRVSLRAVPELNGVLLDRAELGEKLILQDNTQPEWVGVRPPSRIDLWVSGEFLEDGKVIPARLNVRSGPSMSHAVVGVVRKDSEFAVRGEIGGWVKVAPPPESVVWISRAYCDVPGRVEELFAAPVEVAAQEALPETNEMPREVIQVVPAPEPEPAEEISEPVVITGKEYQPEVNAVLVDAAAVLAGSTPLSPDPQKTQGAEWSFTGKLVDEEGVLSKLVDADTGEVLICYVRGNTQQMKKFADRRVSIFGRTYWALGLDRPFVVPVTLQVLEP